MKNSEKQITNRKESGGSLALGVRRKRRILSTKTPIHLVLRSDFAYRHRSLLRHRPLINRILKKNAKRYKVNIYEKAIVSNHIHILIRGNSRNDLQNFFRVVAGHIAQGILQKAPLQQWEINLRDGAHKKNDGDKTTREKANKFWQTRVYTRVMSWGRDFLTVKKYIIQNTLEALGLVVYKPRRKSFAPSSIYPILI